MPDADGWDVDEDEEPDLTDYGHTLVDKCMWFYPMRSG
jgi:hypothetical protein